MGATSDTAIRIVEAAERLFARGGDEATSLRAITREAGVNVAAVHYHFGGRDGLIRVVLDRQVAPINARRIQLLDAAVATYGESVPVPVLLEAFLRPDLEVLDALRGENPQLARFMGRAYTEPGTAVAGFKDAQFAEITARLVPLLRRALPSVDPAQLAVRLRLVIAIVTTLFATAAPPGGSDPLGVADIEDQLDRLVSFLAPGMAAATAAAPPDWPHPHSHRS